MQLRIPDDPRARKEFIAGALAEKKKREERKRQSDPKGGLLAFIRYFWHILEPATPFVEGWVMECLCAHLEAITNKEKVDIDGQERTMNRLLANVPPGFSKSLTVNCFWPAYEWGPRNLPHLRYVAFSYAAELTERDNQKFRDLVCSREYQELWGHVFKIIGDGKVRVTNDKTGFKFASSMGGVGTGERGDRVLCFAGDQNVMTEHGPIAIKDIVDRKMQVNVWSMNENTNRIELKPVTAWHKNKGRSLVKIITEGGANLSVTHNHQVHTALGKVEASLLKAGDHLFASPPVVGKNIKVEVFPCSARADIGDRRSANAELLSNLLASSAAASRNLAGEFGCDDSATLRTTVGVGRQFKIQMRPLSSGANAINGCHAGFEVSRNFLKVLRAVVAAHQGGNLTNSAFCDVRRSVDPSPVPLAIGNVVRSRSVFKIVKRRVPSVAVSMPNFIPIWATAYKGFHDKLVNQPVISFAVQSKAGAGVAIRGLRRLKNLVGNGHDGNAEVAAFLSFNRSSNTSNSAVVGNLITPFKTNNVLPNFDRVVSVEHIHDVPEFVYCLTVKDNHNLFCAGKASSFYVLSKNCDDLHKVKGSESDDLRKSIVQWVREGMSNRLNNLKESAIVIIMQRLHLEDTSGAIMTSNGDEYCHLIVPMEYEVGRHFSHYDGWNDGQDPREDEGELAWPDRFGKTELASFRRNQYLWAGQYQQSPNPRGGGLFKEDWWQVHRVIKNKETGVFRYDPELTSENVRFVIASLDTAFSERESNDFSALTVWTVYDDPITRQRRILLSDAWQKRLSVLHGEAVEKLPGERDGAYTRRAMQKWGLVEWVAHSCTKRRVDRLLVENKNRGHDVVKEIQRLYADRNWGVQAIDIRGDKWSRAHAVVDLFTDGMIYAPAEVTDHDDVRFLEWADMAMREIATFPRGAHDDLVDSTTMALKYLRDNGLAVRRDERRLEDEILASRNHAPKAALYPA